MSKVRWIITVDEDRLKFLAGGAGVVWESPRRLSEVYGFAVLSGGDEPAVKVEGPIILEDEVEETG